LVIDGYRQCLGMLTILFLGTLGGTATSRTDGFGGLVVSILATRTRFCGFKPVGFFGHPENPQYAFLRRGRKIIYPMTQHCGM
jgi:hypothetical protein